VFVCVRVQDVEKELEVQIGMKQEMELSMKMLEKDVCEKQDALVELREQLEDLRVINQQLSHKSQVRPRAAGSRSDLLLLSPYFNGLLLPFFIKETDFFLQHRCTRPVKSLRTLQFL